MDIYVAGAAAAFIVDVLVYPLDTIKTRYQSQDYLGIYGSSSRHKSLAVRGLYQGIGSVVLATLPAAGLFFSTYEKSKTIFSQTLPLPNPLVHACASAVAEMASCLILAPAEVLKQNAQMLRRGHGSTSLQAFRQLAGHGAAGRLFSGYTALLARNLPFTALQFPIFEHVRSRLWRSRLGAGQDASMRMLETGLVAGASAGTAGAMAAFVTTPSDVVKTRMMLAVGDTGGRLAAESRQGSRAVARQIYREKGLGGFFRGALLRSGWTALGSSLYLGTYDMAKLWIKQTK